MGKNGLPSTRTTWSSRKVTLEPSAGAGAARRRVARRVRMEWNRSRRVGRVFEAHRDALTGSVGLAKPRPTLHDRLLNDRHVLGNELDWPVGRGRHHRVRVDAEQVVQRPAEALDLVELVRHPLAELVGRPDYIPALKA